MPGVPWSSSRDRHPETEPELRRGARRRRAPRAGLAGRASGSVRSRRGSAPTRSRTDSDATLPETGEPATEVIERLAEGAEPGLIAIGSPRFYGWVIGGTQPVALAADWLVSAWDQNTGLRTITPGAVAVEELAGEWLLDLLGLPPGSEVGFTTGATMAQFTCMAAARDAVLRRAGWDVETAGHGGRAGDPVHRRRGAPRHGGPRRPIPRARARRSRSPSDEQGRIRVDDLRETLAAGSGPAIVAAAGGQHPLRVRSTTSRAAIEVAHEAGAWVHVDGAFGLWAAASPRLRHLVAGMDAADSWSTDAHKTLSVPYDCGIAIVRDGRRDARRAQHAGELPAGDRGRRRPAREGARAVAARSWRPDVGGAPLPRPHGRRATRRRARRCRTRHRRRRGRAARRRGA